MKVVSAKIPGPSALFALEPHPRDSVGVDNNGFFRQSHYYAATVTLPARACEMDRYDGVGVEHRGLRHGGPPRSTMPRVHLHTHSEAVEMNLIADAGLPALADPGNDNRAPEVPVEIAVPRMLCIFE